MSKEILLEVRDVEKRYGSDRVLTIPTFAIQRGESLLVTGRNGSGKSTFLRILAGVIPVERGVVVRHARLSGACLGYLPQSGGLYPDLTVGENLALRRRLAGLARRPDRGRWYVEELGLGHFLDKPCGGLSGGLQRLVALACALYVEPQWLILDEPFSGIDQANHEVISGHLSQLGADLLAVIVSNPEQSTMFSASRMVHFQSGTIV
jgi:ABC-2 type transport system ATP-binding protein